MANYVTIGTLAPPPPPIPPDMDLEKAVEEVIEFWRLYVSRVLPDKVDLILLPEACDRPAKAGWTKERLKEYFEARGDKVKDFFVEVAAENACYVAYSAKRQAEDGTWRNSTTLIDRTGGVAGIYNKNHVTLTEFEEGGCLYGKRAPLIGCDFGKVACAICFDLNYDLLRNKYVKAKPDLILFSSMYHGGLMQAYWAYSCRAHFAAAVPGRPSAILSPTGETLATTTNYTHYATATVNLDCALAHLDFNAGKLVELKAKYGRGVKISDPGHLGSVLVSSETEEATVGQMFEEFGLERLDDYFARCLAHRDEPGHIEA